MKFRPLLAAAALLSLASGCATLPKLPTMDEAGATAECVAAVLRGAQASKDDALLDVIFDSAVLADPCLDLVLPNSTEPKER